jgi:hypothetical protein
MSKSHKNLHNDIKTVVKYKTIKDAGNRKQRNSYIKHASAISKIPVHKTINKPVINQH